MCRLSALLCVAVGSIAVAPAGVSAEPTPSQTVFTQKLLDDAKTSAGIKRMLKSKQAIVSPSSGFVDVTGDGRQDALVLVSTQGAAGTVALYVLSTHGQKTGTTNDQTSLKVVFRLQSLYRATLRISGTTLSVLEPRYAKGDDLCCPAKVVERVYAWNDKAKTLKQRSSVEKAGPTAPTTTSWSASGSG